MEPLAAPGPVPNPGDKVLPAEGRSTVAVESDFWENSQKESGTASEVVQNSSTEENSAESDLSNTRGQGPGQQNSGAEEQPTEAAYGLQYRLEDNNSSFVTRSAYIRLDMYGLQTLPAWKIAEVIRDSNQGMGQVIPQGLYVAKHGLLKVYYATKELRDTAISSGLRYEHVLLTLEKPFAETRNENRGEWSRGVWRGSRPVRTWITMTGIPMWMQPGGVQAWLENKGYKVVSGVKRASYRDSVVENGKFEAQIEQDNGSRRIPGALWMPMGGNTYMWVAIWYRGLGERWCLRCGQPGHQRRNCPQTEQARNEQKNSYAQAASRIRQVLEEENLAEDWAAGQEKAMDAEDKLKEILEETAAPHFRKSVNHRCPFSEQELQMSEDPVLLESLLLRRYPDWQRFWGRGFLPFINGRHIFSNFFETNFKVEGETYGSVEQAYYHRTCLAAGLQDEALIIKRATNPLQVKNLSHKMDIQEKAREKGVDVPARTNIMEECVKAKFTSSWFLRNSLMITDGWEPLENNKNDKYWGVGPDAFYIENKDFELRKGTNMLGLILADVREELKQLFPEEWEIVKDRVVSQRDPVEHPLIRRSDRRSTVSENEGRVSDEEKAESQHGSHDGTGEFQTDSEREGAETDVDKDPKEKPEESQLEVEEESSDMEADTEGVEGTGAVDSPPTDGGAKEGENVESDNPEVELIDEGSDETIVTVSGPEANDQKKDACGSGHQKQRKKKRKKASGSSQGSKNESPPSKKVTTPKPSTNSGSRIAQRAQSSQERATGEVRERSLSVRGSKPKPPSSGAASLNTERIKTAPTRMTPYPKRKSVVNNEK